LCQKDYLSIIGSFLQMKELFYLFPILSKFHFNFCGNSNQLFLIKKCLSYDFGKNMFKILNIKLNYSNDKSIFKQISLFYSDFTALVNLANESIKTNIENKNANPIFKHLKKFNKFENVNKNNIIQYDMRLLFLFQRFGIVKHMFEKVEFLLWVSCMFDEMFDEMFDINVIFFDKDI